MVESRLFRFERVGELDGPRALVFVVEGGVVVLLGQKAEGGRDVGRAEIFRLLPVHDQLCTREPLSRDDRSADLSFVRRLLPRITVQQHFKKLFKKI